MRSSITIFFIGLVLGSTLGIGGLWTQVVQPAYGQIEELEEEHGVMQQALDEAGETIEEVAASLRSDAPLEPLKPGEIVPSGITPSPTTPTQPRETRATQRRDRKVLAEELDSLRGRLKKARAGE